MLSAEKKDGVGYLNNLDMEERAKYLMHFISLKKPFC